MLRHCLGNPLSQMLTLHWGLGKGSWTIAGISDLVKFEGLPKCRAISGTSPG